ncbi:S9 family peptidase [uncultured Porphyromonas sp.]|uniref:alpha/beta hydrolase family protein n=1 Tax=uncultured Porphyromonas sp. TaxID=159274 RepID=UPI0026029B4A|nr:alpha/beta fold hydrolase [uncultured Porphyromonas sp.]
MRHNIIVTLILGTLLTLRGLTPLYGQELQEDWWRTGKYAIEDIADPVYSVDEEYMSETPDLYVPIGKSGKLPVVIVIHGFGAKKKQMQPTAQLLASHGMLVLNYTAMDQTQPFQWLDGLISAYHLLEGENRRPESKIYNRVDFQRIGLLGHSMGGAGVLHVAAMEKPNGLRSKIKTVVSMMPYHGTTNAITDAVAGGKDKLGCDISATPNATLIISAELDPTNEPIGGYEFYQTLTRNKRVFFSLKGTKHIDWMNKSGIGSKYYPVAMPVITAWMLTYLCGETQYESYFREGGHYFEKWVRETLKGNVKVGRGEFPAFEIKEP